MRDQVVQRLRRRRRRIAQMRVERRRIGRQHPPDVEGHAVLFNRNAVQQDRLFQRHLADRHEAHLPGRAHQHDVGKDSIPHQPFRGDVGVEPQHVAVAHGAADQRLAPRDAKVGVAVQDQIAGRHLGPVQHDPGAVAIVDRRLGRRTHHRVAADHGISVATLDADLVDRVGRAADADVTQHGPELLREAGEVEDARPLSFQMRGHGDELAHRDNPGAANARDQQVEGAGEVRDGRVRQGAAQRLDVQPGGLGLAALPAFDRDEAGAEAVQAGEVLVAAGQVDPALAAERRFHRLDAEAVRFHRTVAATLADEAVYHREARRVGKLAALAAASLFGGASLFVDQDRDARDPAQLALDGVEIGARMQRRAGGKVAQVELFRPVRHQRDARDPLGPAVVGDARDAHRSVHVLPAGHRHGVVVKDLVGDVRARRDRLPDRHRTRVIPRPVAEILEHVLAAVPALPDRDRHALGAHLREPDVAAAHPARHDVAADAAGRDRSVGDLGRGVVRAARTEERRPRRARHLQHRRGRRGQRARPVLKPLVREEPAQPLGQHRYQHQGRDLARPRQQRIARRAMLADHLAGLRAGPVVEIFLELALDDAPLFLDHQHFFLAGDEGQRVAARQRPDHPDLVDVDAQTPAVVVAKAQQPQRLHRVEMRLAGGDDPEARVRQVVDAAVDRVRLDERLDRAQLVFNPGFDRRTGRVAAADVHPALGSCEVGQDEAAVGRKLDRLPRLDRFRDRLEPDPCARKARQGKAVFPELEVFADRGRVQRRHEPRHEGHVRLVRHRRRHAAMIVARDHQHAAFGRRAIGVPVLERVARPVHARPLAVPHRKHALDRTVGVQRRLLRAKDGGRAQILVHRRQELDPVGRKAFADAPQLLIDPAQRRSAIARHEARRVQPRLPVAPRLIQHDPHQRLGAGQEHAPVLAIVAVRQLIGRKAGVVTGHGWSPCPRIWLSRQCGPLRMKCLFKLALWGAMCG